MRVTKKQIRSLVEQINFDLDILDPAREVAPEATEALEQWMATVGIATLRDCESSDGSGIEFNNKYYDLRCVFTKMRESSRGEVVGGLKQDLGSILKKENKMTLTKNELRQMIFGEILSERWEPGDGVEWLEDKWEEHVTEPLEDAWEENVVEPYCDFTDDVLDDWRRDIERYIERNADELAEYCPTGFQDNWVFSCKELIEDAADDIAECMVAVLNNKFRDMCDD